MPSLAGAFGGQVRFIGSLQKKSPGFMFGAFRKLASMKNISWGKIAAIVGVVLPLIGAMEYGLYHGAKFLLKEEIEQLEHLMEFAKEAEEEIIPNSQRAREEHDIRLDMLESKHSVGWSVGLVWNKTDKKMQYRDEEGILRDAHIHPDYGKWYFINEFGYVEYVYK